MKECIICRQEKTEDEFNDEHVIPDSLGGYYHIDTVCIQCNSEIGYGIDVKLTNHFFAEFPRHHLKIKGKSGKIPNPLEGTYVLDDDSKQKVSVKDIDGKLELKLFPRIEDNPDGYTITLDAKDADQIARITDKKNRKALASGKTIQSQFGSGEIEKPLLSMTKIVDGNDFKMALLKIAYEFTVDQIPTYYEDEQAKIISRVIKNKDFAYNNIIFSGDGLNHEILTPFKILFEFESISKHYIILASVPKLGLICLVNIFDCYNLAIQMSPKANYLDRSNFIALINDISQKTYRVLQSYEVINEVYNTCIHKYETIDHQERLIEKGVNVYSINGNVPLFNNKGLIEYSSFKDKINQKNLKTIPLGDLEDSVGEKVIIDQELYICTLPLFKMERVISISQFHLKNNRL